MSKLELKATFSSMSKGHLEDTLDKCHLEIQGCLFVSVYWSLREHFKKVSFSEKNITKKDTFPRFCLALIQNILVQRWVDSAILGYNAYASF